MPDVDFGEMTAEDRANIDRLAAAEPREAEMLRILGNRPDMIKPYMNYYEELVYGGLLELSVKQAAREEIFRLAGAGGRQDPFDPEPSVDGIVDARIATAIKYANGMARSYQSTGDNEDLRLELESAFSREEVVELGMVVGGTLAMRRFSAVLGRRIESV